MAGDLRDIIAAALDDEMQRAGECDTNPAWSLGCSGAADIALAAIRAAITADPTRLEDLGCEHKASCSHGGLGTEAVVLISNGEHIDLGTPLFRAPQSTEENA